MTRPAQVLTDSNGGGSEPSDRRCRHREPIEPTSADPGGPARAPKDPRQRELDFLCEPRRLPQPRIRHAAGRSHTARPSRAAGRSRAPGPGRARANGGARGTRRVADVSAVAALRLAEPADQVHAQAHRAAVKLRQPVGRRLARRADEHLAVRPDPSFPGALPPVRVDLPCTTAIAGHCRLFRSCRFPQIAAWPTSAAPPALSDTRRYHVPAARGSLPSSERRHSCR
jgi:hypothetical protein